MARGKKKNAPPGIDEASMGPGPPPPDGWGPDGPPPPGGWGPGGPGGPPRGWGPGGLPGGWGPGRPPGGWGPDGPTGGWGPDGPPGGWGPDGHPGGWGPGGPQGGWGPDGPPEFWGPRGPPPPEGWGPGGPPGGWGPRGPQGGWGPGPDGPMPPGGWGPGGPGGWGPGGPPPQHWGHGEWGPDRHPPGGWGNGGPGDWGPGGLPPHGGWGAGGPYGGPPQHPNYVGPPPIPPMGYGAMPVPPDPSYGQMPIVPPSVPPPGFVPPVAYTYPPPPVDSTGVAYPPTWPPEVTPYVAPPPEVMVNPAPEQPEWIKALISAPEKTDVTVEAKPIKTPESKPPTTATAQVPPVAKPQSNDCDDNVKKTKPLNLLGTRTFDKPPAGRSTGIISFIGPSFGYIEREDLEKFTFSFDAFFGNPKAMSPGIRVHFTACKEKNSKIATDVKVAPGGTENVDTEIYEGVVSQNIVQPAPGVKQKPGQIHIHMGPIQTNLTFEKRDCTVTLLRGDRVLINILTDIVTDKRRATNIKPKIPATFKYTKETREKGAIVSISDIEGIIQSEEHGELPFDLIENLGDTPFSPSEEVEFTIFKAKDKDRAIRISKLKAPPVKVEAEVQSRLEEAMKVEDEKNEAMEEERTKEKENEGKEKAEGEEQEEEKKEKEEEDKEKDKEEQKKEEPPAAKDKWMPTSFKELKLQEDEDISKQKFEGTVLKSIVKVPQKEKVGEEPEKEEDNQQGRLVMTLDGEQKQVSFTAADTLTTATMMDGDRIKFNIATHHLTKKERAIFVEILPDSFQESTEQRRTGIAIELEEETGIIRCQQNPQLFFRMSEVMEKRRLVLNEKVEFSVIPHETAEGGTQAIRIKRFVERVFLPVRKLGGIGASKAKKMTIKLTGDLTAKELDSTSKDVPGESNGKSSAESDKLKAVVKTLRAQDNKVSAVKKDYDSSRRRYGRSRSGSRSPVKDKYGRYKKARSTSRDRERIIRNRRSHSRERSRRRSRTRSRSRSRSREKSKERSKDRAIRKRNSDSKDREGSKRSRESSLPPGRVRHGDVVDDELARKKRELDDLNEMIARRKALVSMEPRGGMMDMRMEPEHRTCIDYDHGRIAVPIKEIQPVRSILKKRTESLGGPLFPIKTDSPDPDKYRYNPPTLDHIQPYDDPERLYYDRPYDDPYGDGSYDSRTYGDRYGDQYDSRYRDRAYSSSYDDRFYSDGRQGDRPYIERPFDERSYEQAPANYPQQLRQSPEAQQPPPTQPSRAPVYVQSTHQFPHNESAPEQVGPRSPTPTQPYPRPTSPSQPPLSQSTSLENKPILTTQMSNFLNIFNKGVNPSLVPAAGTGPQNEIPALKEQIHEPVEPEFCEDGLLPHERAVQDGSGFSRILGLVQEEHSSNAASKTASVANVQQFLLRGETTPAAEDHYKSPSPVDQPRRDQDRISSQSPKRSSVEKNCEESKNQSGQFDKIQSLLRTIGIKLSTSGGKTEKSASTEKERQVERHRSQSRTSSADSARAQSPSPARSSSSKEAYGSRQGSQNRLSEYEGFLDKEEEEALERARQMQSLTKTLESTQPIPVTTVPTPPPTQYAQEVLGTSYSSSVLYGWQPGTGAQYPPPQSSGIPNVSHPPPMAYPPPVGYPPYGAPMSYSTNVPPPYYGQPSTVPPPSSSYSLQHETMAPAMPATNTQPSQVSNLKEVTPHSIGDATYQPLTGSTVARCLKMIETVTSAAKEKPVKSVQFNLQPIEPSSPPACAESTDGPQTSADADDDIKTKQKRRLEQFNQRMLEKREQQREQREQQYKEMVSRRRMNKDANPNQPGKPIRSEPRNVWICGHSLVYWAEMRAKSPEVGMQLGMDPSSVVVWWKGTQGMTWPQLLPQLLQLKIKWPNPDVVIMHLGGNDLSTDSPTDLLASVKKDLTSMRSIFPQCVLVWSDILPRRVWRHSEDSHEVDLVRTTINRRVHSIISELGGTALTHDNVRCGSNTGLYRADGVHLSSKGIDTFNLNLQDFLEKWEVDANKISD